MPKLLIAHGGAPTAVLNASLCGAVEAARASGRVDGVLGARGGTRGILDGSFADLGALDAQALARIAGAPGSCIGTSRTPLAPEDYPRMAQSLAQAGVGYALLTGGNGTMDACGRLAQACAPLGIVVGGIPKTIDNDIGVIDHAPGYASAARFAAASMRHIARDVDSLPIHVCIVEYMGRNAGWIAAASALSRRAPGDAPHLVLTPEVPFDEARFLASVEAVWRRGRGVVVAVSEGLRGPDGAPLAPPVFQSGRATYYGDVSAYLTRLVIERLGVKARSEKPGILGRCCAELASPLDRKEARRMGALAARAVLEGRGGLMAGLLRTSDEPYACEETLVPVAEVMLRERLMPEAFLSPDGMDVTDAFLRWARPLLGGPLPDDGPAL